MESTYLVSPPHHQVGEAGDPADGTHECEWKELRRRLPEKKRKNRKSNSVPNCGHPVDIIIVVPAVQRTCFLTSGSVSHSGRTMGMMRR